MSEAKAKKKKLSIPVKLAIALVLGGAAMVYTEFVSAEALVRSIKSTVSKLTISDEERPVGIQIYGRTTEDMVEAAKIVEQAHPDVIDINFGADGGMTVIEYGEDFYDGILALDGVRKLYEKIDADAGGLGTVLVNELSNAAA